MLILYSLPPHVKILQVKAGGRKQQRVYDNIPVNNGTLYVIL